MSCLGSQGVVYRVVLFLVALLACCLGRGVEGFSLPRRRGLSVSSASVTMTPATSTMPTTTTRTTQTSNESLPNEETKSTRRAFLTFCGTTTTTSLFLLSNVPTALAIPEQKVYSANARNLDRLSAGDQSGGSVYNNNPSSPAAAKRRAMLGCKVNAARQAAGVPNEKDCNTRVLGGDNEFMLEALRKLDCPTCPYGIRGA